MSVPYRHKSTGCTIHKDFPFRTLFRKPQPIEQLLLVVSTCGYMRVLYNMIEWDIPQNTVAIFYPGHELQCIECSEDYSNYTICIGEGLLNELKVISFSHNRQLQTPQPVLSLSPAEMVMALKVKDVLQNICQLTNIQPLQKHEMLVSQLCVVLEYIHLGTAGSNRGITPSNRSEDLFNQFYELLAANYRHYHSVTFYAKQLHLAPKYFSRIIHDATGRTPSEWINEYLITQAKRILSTRNTITIQETGYQLGFNEPASFHHFFKRLTGVSPKQYRDNALAASEEQHD